MAKKKIGWHVFLVECADGAFFGGIARNIEKEIKEFGKTKIHPYFIRNKGKLPVKLVFAESNLGFREAFAKFSYLKDMNRRQRLMLLKKKRFNNSWVLYMNGTRSNSSMYGYSINRT